MLRPAFREFMLYPPAKEFNDAEKHIYSGIKISAWEKYLQVHLLNFVISAMISFT
jgi:hypothetical protein